MRRPFALVGNAIASLRTLRTGNLGMKVQNVLGSTNFGGLWLVSAGNIPQGGFSSSSAVTVATKNAINALFDLGISPDLLVHLACQAEYGTGVRAGSLDQATEQKGKASQGTLISSSPKDNYSILGTYPIPHERIQIIFPYSVERDRNAWRWSFGAYAKTTAQKHLTTTEVRKMTGKAAEVAALLVHLPFDTDFFQVIQEDLISDGELNNENRTWISSILLQLPVLIKKQELEERVYAEKEWYASQLVQTNRLDYQTAIQKTEGSLSSLFDGWRDPVLRRTDGKQNVVEETGVPLRAIVAYLFAEVAKNFYLIHHPEDWVEYVTLSQRGDRCFEIDSDRLPDGSEMATNLDWEQGVNGPDLMNLWLEKFAAKPFDFNKGLDDASLSGEQPVDFQRLEGSSFFRGLALIDLAEAMLKRAFGKDSIAVRVNAAGQGDYFQVHLDTNKVGPDDVKRFLRTAFYRRFGLEPDQEFVEIHPGGGASGIRLSRFDALPQLIRRLQMVK